ncbi:MAG: hypothetical protein GY823_09225 [Flavobacteriaceae bacterium]|nr:hypothetical protein [Flavobacteriaceae bacterium]
MKSIKLLLLSFIILSPYSYANNYVIDDYSFEWIVETVGKAELSIKKKNDSLKVILSVKGGIGYDSLYLSPKEAVLIGKALQETDKYYKKQKGSKKDISEKLQAGSYQVTFGTTEKYGFSILVREKGSFSSYISLERKQARKLSKLLIDSENMSSFLDEKIDL